LSWACGYYHHPPGEVIFSALPALLRKGHEAKLRGVKVWRLDNAHSTPDDVQLARAPRQAALVDILKKNPDGLDGGQLSRHVPNWQSTMRALVAKGLVYIDELPCPQSGNPKRIINPVKHPLSNSQQQAAAAVCQALDRFQPFLLDGVTGSGKTEVYMHIIDQVIAARKQALVLVPEIGLTPQLINRFEDHFRTTPAVLHSGLSDRERLHAWLMAKNGVASIVIGTRSAVFKSPGIIIIDEEHDVSFKQQEGFRYHARQVAIVRAQQADIPILLGSATPSLESLYNVEVGRFQHLHLPERAASASHPEIKLLDIRHQKMDNNLSAPLLRAITRHLTMGNQVLVFLNRRGFAPTLICHDCGWVARCSRCDAHMILHRGKRQLRCHHCDAQREVDTLCPECNSPDLRPLGHGTERIEEALKEHFPTTEVIRIDRDSTRRKGTLQMMMEGATEGQNQILVGTQMLAKGHHLPNVTLVAIIDADQGLFGIDFRAAEHLGQLIIQVAGRAGRADKKGEVLAQLPPYRHLVLLRAEAATPEVPLGFLRETRVLAEAQHRNEVRFLGPVAAPMERRAGRYRCHLLIQSDSRRALHSFLNVWVNQIESLPTSRKVRWSLDVDPVDLM
jgi:primosomal protein N' (replication factor Y)